ncbi:MAG TPA: hypothetical protein VIM98_00220 [Dyella sp.]|uniref:hypothetical protein n=1 Tax=Dyella sp. TaxID=1869338 RepID=UPI002F922DD4
MSSIIEFLERMGGSAPLRNGSDAELALALDEAQVDATASSAILTKDPSRLQKFLGVESMFIVQMPVEEEEEDGEEDEEIPESRYVPTS